MTTQKINSSNMNSGKLENWSELEEIEKKEEKFKKKKRKFKEEEKWIINKFYLRIKLWGQMLQTTQPKQNMSTCKNIITKGHFIKILKIQFLRGIIIYRLHYKCKTNQCYHKFCKKGRAVLGKKGKVNTSI